MSVAGRLKRWKEAGLLDQAAVNRILAYEKSRGGLKVANAMYGVGALAILLGIAAIIGVNWDQIPTFVKLGTHTLVNAGVVAAIFYLLKQNKKPVLIDLLLAVLAGLTLTFIALVGQIYQSQEPTWKALTLWLVLVSPFFFALVRSRHLVSLWILAFFFTYGMFLFDKDDGFGPLTSVLLISLLPFAMIAVGQSGILRRLREHWAISISYAGFILAIALASLMQVGWRSVVHGLYVTNFDASRHLIEWKAYLITLAAAVGIIVARRMKWLVTMPSAVDLFLPVSVIVAFLPVLVPHGDWAVVGAGVVMVYWVFCGWMAAVAGYPRGLDIATVFIAIRLVVVYVEVFGSLLQTGVGLIVSGVLLIGLVVVTRRIMARLHPLRERKRR